MQRTTYKDGDAAPTSIGGDTSQARIGDNPTPPRNDQRITRTAAAAAEDDLSRAPKASVFGGFRLRDSSSGAIAWAEFLRDYKNWILFLVGNLISAAVVVSEISLVNGCFDEPPPEESNDAVGGGRAGNNAAVSEADKGDSIRSIVIALLVFGLATELISAAVLSFQYRSPLDVKSVRKIAPDGVRGCGAASIVVNFLAPFSWGVIYTCGSYVTIQVDTFASCGGHEGFGLVMYLVVSGLCMFFVGLVLLGLAVFIFMFSCGSPVRCADACCAVVRRKYSRRILSIAALFDVFWHVQGSVWLYRTGAVDGVGFVVFVVFCIVGGVLAALGSQAPGSTRELPEHAPPVALPEQKDAADGI